MIKLCIFDLDGTLLDTVHTIAYYGNRALGEYGIPPLAEDGFKYYAGNGMKNLVKNMLAAAGSYDGETYEKVLEAYDSAYNNDAAYKTKIFDGLKETLDKLKARGIKLAVATNKPQFAAQSVIEHFYGKGYFEIIWGQRDSLPLKPDPYSVNEIIAGAKVSKNEVMYIGDTSVDMKTGKNAGLFTVGVLWGFRSRKELEESGADILINAPEELYGLATEVKQND